jgi:hypothetical protein
MELHGSARNGFAQWCRLPIWLIEVPRFILLDKSAEAISASITGV